MKKLLFVIMGFCLVFGVIGCKSSSHHYAATSTAGEEESNGNGSSTDDSKSNGTDGGGVLALTAYDVAGITTPMGSPLDITLSVAAPEGAALTYNVKSAPGHGILTQVGGGVWRYTPAANYVGSDSFTYSVSDSGVESNTATVSLMVLSTTDISATGGNGTFNHGGRGGSLQVNSIRNLSLTGDGYLDSSFGVDAVDESDAELGPNPMVFTSNTVVMVRNWEPEEGKPYMVEGSTNLYISDNDGSFAEADEIATGMKVMPGVVVEFEANNPEFNPYPRDEEQADLFAMKPSEWLCKIAFTGNVLIYGTVRTKPVPDHFRINYVPDHNPYGSNSRGSLGLNSMSWVDYYGVRHGGQVYVAPGGVIDCSGDTGTPLPSDGGHGGKLWLHAYDLMVLKGMLKPPAARV
jgi:hypothetical protein